MELLKAIEIADKLCPNPYTQEEKLLWCQELSAIIRREIKKEYDFAMTTISDTGEIILPDGICFEDIEAAYIDGIYMSKLDMRSFLAEPTVRPGSATVKLIYLTRPYPVRNICISGKFDLSENFIKIDTPPFIPGDTLEYVILEDDSQVPGWDNCKTCQVLDIVYDGLVTESDAFTPQTAANMHIRRVIDDVTETDTDAYDNIYVEYLLAKMAMYQHDYSGYNAHIAQYNILYDGLKKDYKNRSPLNELSVFKNYWYM